MKLKEVALMAMALSGSLLIAQLWLTYVMNNWTAILIQQFIFWDFIYSYEKNKNKNLKYLTCQTCKTTCLVK